MREHQHSDRFNRHFSKARQEELKPAKNTPQAVIAEITASALAWFGRLRFGKKHTGRNCEAVRRVRLVGRNEPCPCGSGKKYKRCCLK
jgi:uncharacterized protein YecA (UPF0149 family)